ncbi:MAG: class I SAM-dependent methyltransferase [Bryobacterales bacterium]|nr:class I SAM-dependent methyltransferase [Bryobacterales bacterium]
MADRELCQRMREDWNRRAREDAKYYVAFGRRGQDDEEFFASGRELAQTLAREFRRLPPGNPRARRVLEIGCGLGRLMMHLAVHCGEIHGVDVSDEMVRLAREKLAGIPHAHVHVNSGADLAPFADDSFDFLYSYAVFQHIPSRQTVFCYLKEAWRVLKPGGVFRFQLNGLPGMTEGADTWYGVSISAEEIAWFARENDFQLLALEGAGTQYQWVTVRKRAPGWFASLERTEPRASSRILRITNAYSSEPVAAARGRFAAASLWLENAPEDCDLNSLLALVAGKQARAAYLGPPHHGLVQLNIELPAGVPSGLQPIELFWLGRPLAPPAFLRVIPPPPPGPPPPAGRGAGDLLAGPGNGRGAVRVVLEEVANPECVEAWLGGQPVPSRQIACVESRTPTHVLTFPLPPGTRPGEHVLEIRLGRRRFPPIRLEVMA